RVRVEFGRLVGHQRAAGDGVEGWYGLPALRVAGLPGGEGERDGLTAPVEAEEERLVAEPLAARVLAANAVAPQQEAEGGQAVLFPAARRHLAAVRVPPRRILDALRVRLAGEEVAAAERGVRPAEGEGLADEIEEGRLALVEVPVVPVDLVVLAVGVVVAALRLAQLVAAEEHGDALREEQRAHERALEAVAAGEDALVVRRPLDAAVGREVGLVAVAVVLAVGLVVLLLVGDEVLQREPVVGGDEVDGGERAAAGALVEVGRPGDARGEVGLEAGVAPPELADGVAVAPVPLGPLPGEGADLVAARAYVPRLGDELDAAQDGVLL